jgi:hypothetical protein
MANVAIPSEGPKPTPRWIEPFGLAALLAVGSALLCASIPSLCGLVVPLGGAGLILGIVGVFRVLAKGQFRLAIPAAAMAVGCAAVFSALLLPHLLGPVYLGSRTREAVDSRAIRVVSFSGRGGAARPGEPESVEANQAALQQGPLHVQVISASIRSVKAKSAPAKHIPPGEYLFIRLRTHSVEAAGEFTAKRSPTPGHRFEKVQPRLMDKTGRVYPSRDIQEVVAEENENKRSVFPVTFQDEVLAFEPPGPDLEYLRLEVPSASRSPVP